MKESLAMVIFLGFMGIFAIVGSVMNWSWFMESRKAAFFVKILGRNGTRIFYGAIGVAVLGFAVYGYFNPEVMHSRRLGI